MHPQPLDPVGSGLFEQGVEVINVAVHVAVGYHAHQMQGAALLRVPAHLGPCPAGKYFPGLECLADQFGPLGKNPAGPQGIVAHFGIAHVSI